MNDGVDRRVRLEEALEPREVLEVELLESGAKSRPLSSGIGVKRLVVAFAAVAVVTGGVLSWFASTNPDGLEWSVEKVFGRADLPERESGVAPVLKWLQDKTAFLPDYSFKKPDGAQESAESTHSWPAPEPGKSISGIIGSVMVLAAVLVIGLVIRALRRKKSRR
jgi:cobalt/nickel transport system permease protein